MCGIIGITRNSGSSPIGQLVFDALTRLEYRGYDSVGIATINQEKLLIRKDKGAIRDVGQRLQFKDLNGNIAIGHSRWATHGPPSKINAHPHQSQIGDVVVVHNGIIENFLELKAQLELLGYSFESQTDTELIPHFLSYKITKEGMSTIKAIQMLTQQIKGTYAIVTFNLREPKKIYAVKKDNPLVLGITEETMYCASDIPAFLPWTKEIVTLKDDELAVLEPGKYEVYSLADLSKINKKSHTVTWNSEAAQKGGFPHHMLKEIHEQSKILRTQLSTQTKLISDIASVINNASKTIVVAAGTAYYAAMNSFHLFSRFGAPITIPSISAEWNEIRHLVDDETVILAVSQSGETLDTIKAIKDAKTRNAKIVSIVNVIGSSLTHLSDHIAYIHAGPEIGVAATKTYSAQSLAVWRIAREISAINNSLDKDELKEYDNALKLLPNTIDTIIRDVEIKTRDLSKWFQRKNSAFYLGRGISYLSALEGALKMKEISYIHAEAYPAGESKHGPIALVENDFPVVFTIPKDYTRDKMMGSVQEMAARGATTIGIIEKNDTQMINTLDHYFEIPIGYSKYLSTITYTLPQQLLAYYTSAGKGLNPDMPKNLAKSVTVE